MFKYLKRKVIMLIVIGLFIATCFMPTIVGENKRGFVPFEKSDFDWDNSLIAPSINKNNLVVEKQQNEYNFPTEADFDLDQKKNWTWLFYDDADFYQAYDPLNDFADETYSNDKMNVLVLQDKEYSGAKLWYIGQNHRTQLIQDMGEINMGSNKTLYDFIMYCKEYYPADRYILSFYNHGGGWYGACVDNTDNDILSMNEIQDAIGSAGGVDLVLFTAPCLMGALESAYELRDCIDVYIGSEEYSGYGHWFGTIEDICNLITSNVDISNYELGQQIITFISYNSNWKNSLTMSAVRTDKMDELASAINVTAEDFINYRTESYDKFWNLYDSIQSFGDGFCIDFYHFAQTCANADFCEKIIQDLDLVMSSLKESIIAESHGDDYPNANGLTIYFPNPLQLLYNQLYDKSDYGLDFSADTQWDEFVKSYLKIPVEPDADQSQLEHTSGMIVCERFVWAQSFVPSKDILRKVKLKLTRCGQIESYLTVSIRKNKDGNDLTVVSVNYEDVPTNIFSWISFNFPDILVNPNETYFIVLSTDSGDNSENFYTWACSNNPDSYPGGEVWIQWSSEGHWQWQIWDPPIDSCFITYSNKTQLDPPIINGPGMGKLDESYEYLLETPDYENNITYLINWGDGTDSGWFGPFEIGEKILISHSWSSSGIYEIKAKAKNETGYETAWSEPFVVHVTKSSISLFILDLIFKLEERFPSLKPLLDPLVELICS
ncbi:MAG: hypothetical protein JXA91_00735 [Candidatus Thermoplasmatota archaeon]|nr:hypothetical protein [Candidatus Thermoplasmatota archaeon]